MYGATQPSVRSASLRQAILSKGIEITESDEDPENEIGTLPNLPACHRGGSGIADESGSASSFGLKAVNRRVRGSSPFRGAFHPGYATSETGSRVAPQTKAWDVGPTPLFLAAHSSGLSQNPDQFA